jgi:hypothetical protein
MINEIHGLVAIDVNGDLLYVSNTQEQPYIRVTVPNQVPSELPAYLYIRDGNIVRIRPTQVQGLAQDEPSENLQLLHLHGEFNNTT